VIISDPRDWRCLETGDTLQQRAYSALARNRVFEHLAEFDPAHVSTIGNCLAIETSDIDIICSYSDRQHFERVVQNAFGELRGFSLSTRINRGAEAVVAQFVDDLPVEIYAETTPTEQQFGYRHYIVITKLLHLAGEPLRNAICELKRAGLKTEPAVAQILGLKGDPYLALIALEGLSLPALRELVL
jgi:hypothetical protein